MGTHGHENSNNNSNTHQHNKDNKSKSRNHNGKKSSETNNQTTTTQTKTENEFKRISAAPPFSYKQLQNAIPAHCWIKNPYHSLFYYFKDMIQISLIYLLLNYLGKLEVMSNHPILWGLVLVVYSLIQGTFFWALFVVGHDCGHGSFSESSTLNHFVGHLSHTFLLVPFHSWRLSHHLHHTYHSNVNKDHSYVAYSKSDYDKMSPFSRFFRFSAYYLGGWPAYLLMGMANKEDYHFWPNDALCKNDQERRQMTESIVWIAGFVGLLSLIGYFQGIPFVFVYYGLPYFVFSAWISIVTHLHHTHPDVPWYRDPDWSYLRGALSTVDRNYGLVEDIHHNIGTHIVHHLFHKIPHYHLKEATQAIKPILGEYHKKSDLTMFDSMTKIWSNCRFVSDIGTVLFYQGDKRI